MLARFTGLALLLAAMGCKDGDVNDTSGGGGGGGGGESLDSDGDGLTDAEEAELGTDPDNADSDGDLYSDYDEVELGTDPLDYWDHAYTGGWPVDVDCRDDVTSTGNEVGEIAEYWEASDQNTDKVKLYDFCAHAVLLGTAEFG